MTLLIDYHFEFFNNEHLVKKNPNNKNVDFVISKKVGSATASSDHLTLPNPKSSEESGKPKRISHKRGGP